MTFWFFIRPFGVVYSLYEPEIFNLVITSYNIGCTKYCSTSKTIYRALGVGEIANPATYIFFI